MNQKVNKKISEVEMVRAVQEEMDRQGLSAAKLSRLSGVSRGVISRFLNDDGISANNLYALFKALGMVSGSNTATKGGQDNMDLELFKMLIAAQDRTIAAQEKRIDDLKDSVNNLTRDYQDFKIKTEEQRAMMELTITHMRARMRLAAEKKDFSCLDQDLPTGTEG